MSVVWVSMLDWNIGIRENLINQNYLATRKKCSSTLKNHNPKIDLLLAMTTSVGGQYQVQLFDIDMFNIG